MSRPVKKTARKRERRKQFAEMAKSILQVKREPKRKERVRGRKCHNQREEKNCNNGYKYQTQASLGREGQSRIDQDRVQNSPSERHKLLAPWFLFWLTLKGRRRNVMPFTAAPIRKFITSYYLLPHMPENSSYPLQIPQSFSHHCATSYKIWCDLAEVVQV